MWWDGNEKVGFGGGLCGRKKGCEQVDSSPGRTRAAWAPGLAHMKRPEQCSAPRVWSSGLAHRRRLKYRDDCNSLAPLSNWFTLWCRASHFTPICLQFSVCQMRQQDFSWFVQSFPSLTFCKPTILQAHEHLSLMKVNARNDKRWCSPTPSDCPPTHKSDAWFALNIRSELLIHTRNKPMDWVIL